MLRLPFKTFPKEFEKATVGNPEIGELELPKYGDITPNERLFIKAANLMDVRLAAVRLAKDIAIKSGQTTLNIYNALTLGDSESVADYLEEFVIFQDDMEKNSRDRNFVLATLIIKRISPEWELADTQDVNQIHPLLVQEIANFARNEESGWPISIAETTEVDLGNSTPTSEIPTGEKFTGESAATGRKKKDSLKEDLETSQPG